MNICLYKGSFNYEVVNYFVDELEDTLIRRGHNVCVVDLKKIRNDIEINQLIEYLKNQKIELVVSYNGTGILKSKIYEMLNIVFISILVDHPAYHYDRIIDIKDKKHVITLHDEGAIKTAEKYIDSKKIYSHLMHGGSHASKEYKEKIYDVVVLGGINKENLCIEKDMKKIDDDFIESIGMKLYYEAKDDLVHTLDFHLENVIKSMKIKEEILNLKAFKQILMYLYTIVDRTIRCELRFNHIKNLISNNIKVDYFGLCNIDEFNDSKYFVNHGSVEYKEVLEVMAKSKILIHDMCYFKNGSHERVFSAMLNGALVVSNRNNYSYNMYKDKESIVYYDTGNFNDLVSTVKYYLKNDEERNQIVTKAYNITSKYNTWENRAEGILELYDIVNNMK